MAVERKYALKGLNKRLTPITMPPEYSTDCLNVHLDKKGQITKRYGYDTDQALPTSIVDTINSELLGKIIGISPSALRDMTNGQFKSIPLGGSLPSGNGWSEGVDYAEYNRIVYITDIAGDTDLFKYDGYYAYRAGLPAPTATPSGSGARYYRLVFYFIDAQGNVHRSDYTQLSGLPVNASFTVNTLNGTEFYSKGGLSSASQTIDSTNLVIQAISGHNYLAGDFIRMFSSSGKFIMVEVESVTATTITLTAASVGADSFTLGNAEPLERRLHLEVYWSDNATFGYVLDNTVAVINSSQATNVINTSGAGSTPMEDIIDTTLVNGLPPRCKYVTVYGNTLVLANKINERVLAYDINDYSEDQIFWSDTAVGFTVESFPPFNREQIGRSDEGLISGLYSSSDNLIIFKTKQVYYINGILVGRGFRLRSSLSAEIGCVSHKSIIPAQSGCMFMSHRGVYFANSGVPVEMTDSIEPLFTADTTGLDLTKCRGMLDEISEHLYFYIPNATSSIVLLYDYYYKQWFVLDSIEASAGLIRHFFDNYFSDGSKLFKQSQHFNDSGKAINAYYWTGWYDLGTPALKKKFTNFVVHSINQLEWEAQIKTQINWTDEDKTDQTIQFDDIVMNEDQRPDNNQPYSMRFMIGNSNVNEPMIITGYEVEWQPTQRAAKGSD